MGGADLIEVEARLGDGATATDLTPLVDAVVFACGRVGLTRATVGLVVVSPDEMASINGEHRGKAEPTDVLSFPIDGTDDPGDGQWMVGDVVLCPSVAVAQASEHAGTPADELALLVVHGGLHLAGWDHAEPREQAGMWSRERELLTDLHGAPARDPWTKGVAP